MRVKQQFITLLAIISLLSPYANWVHAQEENSSTTNGAVTTQSESPNVTTEPSVSPSETSLETTVASSEEETTSNPAVADKPAETTEAETETTEELAKPEAAATVHPIHLTLNRIYDFGVEYIARIDWLPKKYTGKYVVVDSLGRFIEDGDFNIKGLSDSSYILLSFFPDGVYTFLAWGETDSRDNNQKFRGKVSFEVKNIRYIRTVKVPAALKNIEKPIDYIDVGINPIYLNVEKDYDDENTARIEATIDWTPYSYSGNYKVYNSQKKIVHESKLDFITLVEYGFFSVKNYPDGIYTIVTEGVTGARNKNQKFRGVTAIEIKNGKVSKTVPVPSGFDLGTKSIESVTRSIKSGQTPSLPSTVKVTWEDGSVTNEKVTWSKGNYTNKTAKAKTVKLTGTIAHTSKKATATITVHGIKRIDETKVTTKSGLLPKLPKTVKVTWTDGSKTNQAVNWGQLKLSTYTSDKQKVVTLTKAIANTDLKAKARITVIVISKITNPTILTAANQAPNMPSTVEVKWSNNSISNEKVKWDTIPASNYQTSKDKTFTVKGKLTEIKTSLTVTAKVSVLTKLNAMHRLYNPHNREHFYTASLHEKNTLVRIGWGKYEGIGRYAPLSGTPVYRLYHKGVRDHHYTLDKHERDVLVAKHGWTDEGIAWYSGGTKPLYRLYNPRLTSGAHHYTTDENEKNVLVANYGWKYEGIAWYGVK